MTNEAHHEKLEAAAKTNLNGSKARGSTPTSKKSPTSRVREFLNKLQCDQNGQFSPFAIASEDVLSKKFDQRVVLLLWIPGSGYVNKGDC